ncbi:MAG: Flp pilus assembly protein CpaB [Acidobacteriia bacterium]|nr:Flp pilus assembly protein CpaB [Terriglobia bacterium]
MDRQKLLTVFGVAWLSAALLTWFLYAKTKSPKTEKTVKVVAALKELPAGTRLIKDHLKMVTVVEKEMPAGAFTAPADAMGHALLYPVAANEPITAARLATMGGAEGVAATIEPGMRAISVAYTDASGASGLIQPRSHVDVLYTRAGNLFESMTVTILEDVTVLSVGRVTEIQQSSAITAKANVTRSSNQTATLMVTPEDTKKLELAKNQGKLSLALRNPMDRSVQADASPVTAEQIEPMLLMRSDTKRPPRMQANVKDKSAWARLVGEDEPAKPKQEPKKEPPKPRLVVDVFRGEKHVQEIFQ